MPSILESHLELLEKEAAPQISDAQDEVKRVEQMIAIHLTVFNLLEDQIGDEGLTESHRPLVPLFQRWLETARQIKAAVGALRAKGKTAANFDDLLRMMNRSKPIAEDFDEMVALNERVARGEPGEYFPLAEVLDELRNKP